MVDPTHGCTRFLVQQANATILGIEFRQGGICTRLAPESERVPVVAGGQRVVDLRIGSCVCVDCAASILSARGGDPQLGTEEVGANLDVEGTKVRCRWLDPPPQLLVHVDHELQSDTTQEPPAAAVAPNARTARENLNDEELQEETVMALSARIS